MQSKFFIWAPLRLPPALEIPQRKSNRKNKREISVASFQLPLSERAFWSCLRPINQRSEGLTPQSVILSFPHVSRLLLQDQVIIRNLIAVWLMRISIIEEETLMPFDARKLKLMSFSSRRTKGVYVSFPIYGIEREIHDSVQFKSLFGIWLMVQIGPLKMKPRLCSS